MLKKLALVASLIALLFFPGDRVFLGWESASAQVPIGNFREFIVPFTPVATAAAIGVSQQTVTVTGLTLQDIPYVIGPVPTALCPMTGYRVSAANTLQIDYATLTAAACTPSAGTLTVIAMK